MFWLAIESSAQTGSVAILEDGRIRCSLVSGVERTHSEKLMPLVDRAFDLSGVVCSQIGAIAVSAGPGSFTGLRIGVAAAKGLAMGLGVPLFPVETLHAVAYNAFGAEAPVCVVTGSRKNELYTATFRWRGDRVERLTEDAVETPERIVARIESPTLFIGDGVALWRDLFVGVLGDLFIEAPVELSLPRAEIVGYLGRLMFQRGERFDLSSLAPTYVREPTPILRKRIQKKQERS